jgi:hypothetical protein
MISTMLWSVFTEYANQRANEEIAIPETKVAAAERGPPFVSGYRHLRPASLGVCAPAVAFALAP